ncbi:MAG: hypothetical protein EI684_03495 [Candidatus Viridilinea halotolerans]|uniref:NADPH-dependent FMN reductase-like domain-containing protein n=1 Tax=Candidatus Viridilinea halotolerans TaxID=2491704 RepID=A0A426U7X7_9CHLR|nr:MAG: hypothetical protein EI684_03495 [Candidatus Viridilinea halotolerans]
MHDGYLYTLGICGSTAGNGPAPQCLDLMLAALPPVKRAAYLGEVLLDHASPGFRDPLLAPLYVELADAELLLIVTPLPGGQLPPRLQALAHVLCKTPLVSAPRYAIFIGFADHPPHALDALRLALTLNNTTLLHERFAPTAANPVAIATEAIIWAQHAYACARRHHPEALP